jgi:hypothetical protein
MFSFTRRKKTLDLQRYIRRLCDLTSPALSPLEGDVRTDNRHSRVIPTLLCPWEEDGPIADQATIVLTKDISDRGVGLVLQHPLRAEHVLLGFLLADETDPLFFLGDIRQNSPIGGGYWVIGVELTDMVNICDFDSLEQLRPMAAKLSRPRPAAAESFSG